MEISIYDGFRVIQERDSNSIPTVSYTRGRDLSGRLQGAGGIGGLLARVGVADRSVAETERSEKPTSQGSLGAEQGWRFLRCGARPSERG